MAAVATLPQTKANGSERGLIDSAAAGDADAFSRLYHRYSSSVFNLVLRSVRNRQLAEDLCQEIWLKAHRQLGTLRQSGAFSTWLYRIAARSCVDAARKRSAVPEALELTDRERAPSAADPETAALQAERGRLTWEALGALPARQHLALFLKEVEGQSYREIANVLETSDSAVETLLFRARRNFAETFERLRTVRAERCSQARLAIANIIDGEGTPVRQRAVHAHIDECDSCRREVAQAQQTSLAYAALPLLPVSPVLAERVFGSLGFASSAAGAGSVAAKLMALALAKTKLLTAAVTLTGGLTAAALVTPGDAPLPGAAHSLQRSGGGSTPASSASQPAGSGAALTANSHVEAGGDIEAPVASHEAAATPVPAAVNGLRPALGDLGLIDSAVTAAAGLVEDLSGSAGPLPGGAGVSTEVDISGELTIPSADISGTASLDVAGQPPRLPAAPPAVEQILHLP